MEKNILCRSTVQKSKKALYSPILYKLFAIVCFLIPQQINAAEEGASQTNLTPQPVFQSGAENKTAALNNQTQSSQEQAQLLDTKDQPSTGSSTTDKKQATDLRKKLSKIETPSYKKSNSTVSISVRHADLAEVFEMMSKHGRVNILLANGVQGEVSINLYEIDLHEAIKAVAIAAGFAVEKSGNTYFVVTRDDAGKEIVDGLTVVKSFKVQYSDSNVVATILSDHLSRYGKITALPERRLVVVEDLPEFMERMESLLEELDSPPVQILIEAQILEVRLDRTDAFGINWRNIFSSSDGVGSIGTSALAVPGTGLFFEIVNSKIEAALGALSSKGRIRTLSTPKLMALEHQEAEVIIGDRIGYTEVTLTEGGNQIQNVEFLDSGVILRVTPFVDRSGKIMMEIHPEVSSASLNGGVPSLQTTEVTTQLLAADGETIFIGGLIKNNTVNERDGIPVLSDIPVVGYAFRSQSDTVANTETVVMITPRIVKAHQDIQYSSEMENKIKIGEIDATLKNEGQDINNVFKNHKPIGKKFNPLDL
ncbi:MAG: type II secretion system protein GspD [Gammaproteobacteria bacterium]